MAAKRETCTLIHIGKCGGSTVARIFDQNRVSYRKQHLKRVWFDPDEKYVVCLRNPIERFVSAFHWRYKLVVVDKSQSNRFSGEKEVLERYESANKLAETIDTFDIRETYIHHIKEDIAYYISDFVENAKKKNIMGVITTEYLNDDVMKLFGIRNTFHENRNELEKPVLSPLARAKLREYLKRDYECINKLYKMGCLTKEQYAVLSKDGISGKNPLHDTEI
jgi:hypothetical protein